MIVAFKKILTLHFSLIIFSSCGQQKQTFDITNHFLEEEYSPELNVKNNIQMRKCYEIETYENKTSERKLRDILYFNSKGLCTLKVKPRYLFIKTDNTGLNSRESNVSTGLNDSTFYVFDDKNRLINKIESFPRDATRQWRSSLDLTYDNNNNIIKRCVTSNESANMCTFIKYKYDSEQNVQVATDSSFEIRNEKPYTNSRKYLYNKNKQMIFDGMAYYEYTSLGQLKRKYKKSDDKIHTSTEYLYNDFGNIILRKSNVSQWKYQKNYMYNNNNLIIETQDKDISKNKITIKKYYYE